MGSTSRQTWGGTIFSSGHELLLPNSSLLTSPCTSNTSPPFQCLAYFRDDDNANAKIVGTVVGAPEPPPLSLLMLAFGLLGASHLRRLKVRK